MNPFKILLLIIFLAFSVDTTMAQSDRKEQRKTERAERKRLKEEERKNRQEKLLSLVRDKTLVLEATTLYNRYMLPYHVSPTTNFVKVEGNQLTVQTASNFGFGYNGLGGVTVNGTITNYKITSSDKNGGASVQIQFSSPGIGFSSLSLDVQANGSARAMLIDSRGGRVTFQGELVSLEESSVFKGRPLI